MDCRTCSGGRLKLLRLAPQQRANVPHAYVRRCGEATSDRDVLSPSPPSMVSTSPAVHRLGGFQDRAVVPRVRKRRGGRAIPERLFTRAQVTTSAGSSGDYTGPIRRKRSCNRPGPQLLGKAPLYRWQLSQNLNNGGNLLAEFVDSTIKEIDGRLQELRGEVSRLEVARSALAGERRRPGRPRGSSARAAGSTGRPTRGARSSSHHRSLGADVDSSRR